MWFVADESWKARGRTVSDEDFGASREREEEGEGGKGEKARNERMSVGNNNNNVCVCVSVCQKITSSSPAVRSMKVFHINACMRYGPSLLSPQKPAAVLAFL